MGRPIYPKTYVILLGIGKTLVENGYREKTNKPNLFYKHTEGGYFYADLRGTEIVPIYEDPTALFYAFLEGPAWKQRRLWKREMEALHEQGCPIRLSFEFATTPPFDEVSSFVDESAGQFIWPTGICYYCGKDFQDEGEYCSKECEEKDRVRGLPKCEICGKPVEYEQRIEHHTSYFPERIIIVDRGCHNVIHNTDKYPSLKPSKEDILKFYAAKGNKELNI